ncbi:capsular biosynthesis protein [Bacillus methanolicus]|nr:capsular biosynthesis protein [Bacillus methanolicus]
MLSAVLLLSSILLLINMYFQEKEQEKAIKVHYVAKMQATRTSIPVEKTLDEKIFVEKATLAAIGDILIHDWLYEDAKTKNGYDFKPMLKEVKPLLLKPDLLLANQETVLGGTKLGLSSYPLFNSPQEVGDAFIDAGVDIVSTANNHSLDKGEKGIFAAIDYYHKANLPYVGSFKDKKDQQTLRILNANGIRVAYLSFTYGTNGIQIPPGKEYLVNLIDRLKMKNEIQRAKQEADIVVISIHWGNEYQRFPSEKQKQLARFLSNEGADIIFGHHPHVLQPMDWIKANDGRKTLVVYSLGNFLSGQMWDYKDIGGIATVEVTKHVSPSGTKIELSNPQFIPTFVKNSHLRNYQVVPLQTIGTAKYNEIMEHMTQWLR